MKRRKKWGLVWVLVTVLVLGVEAAALLVPGEGDTLSWHVKNLTASHPETFGTAVFLLLAWLVVHWFVWPRWRKREDNEK